MRQTSQISIDNYFQSVKPKLTEREKWVLEALEDIGPACSEDIASYLKVPINVVSGRMTGLKKKKQIRLAYTALNLRGSKASYWKAVSEEREYADSE